MLYRARGNGLLILLVCLALISACQFAPASENTPTASLPLPTKQASPPTTLVPPTVFTDIFQACPLDEQAQALRSNQGVNWQKIGLSACYRLGLEIDETTQPLPAHETLVYTNNTGGSLPDLVFRLYPNSKNNYNGKMTVTSVQVNQKDSPSEVFLEDRTALRVPLDPPLPAGKTVRVDLVFTVVPPKDLGAPGAYGIFNHSSAGPIFTLANWFPILAVRKNGQWQAGPVLLEGDAVTSETALFHATISTPESWKVVTSGVQLTETAQNGTATRVFVSGPTRDFMVVASPAFESRQVTHNGVKITQWGLSDSQSGWDTSLKYATSALDVYDSSYGAYPFNELDIVADPLQNASGVEYPGLILIINSAYQGRQFPGFLQVVIAHEIAHQWWYSVVGNDVLLDPWQDEGLTTFSTLAYLQKNGPQIYNQFLSDYPRQVSQVENEYGEMKLTDPLSAFQTRLSAYGPIVYQKSALFFNALRQQIGDDAFQRALQRYFQENRFQLASPHSLLSSFSATCRCDLGAFYQSWGVDPLSP